MAPPVYEDASYSHLPSDPEILYSNLSFPDIQQTNVCREATKSYSHINPLWLQKITFVYNVKYEWIN